jgi:hypothetical protein
MPLTFVIILYNVKNRNWLALDKKTGTVFYTEDITLAQQFGDNVEVQSFLQTYNPTAQLEQFWVTYT